MNQKPLNGRTPAAKEEMEKTRICYKCKQEKELNQFSKLPFRNAHRTTCKSCIRKQTEKVRRRKLINSFKKHSSFKTLQN